MSPSESGRPVASCRAKRHRKGSMIQHDNISRGQTRVSFYFDGQYIVGAYRDTENRAGGKHFDKAHALPSGIEFSYTIFTFWRGRTDQSSYLHWVVLPLLQLPQPQSEIRQPTCQRSQTWPGSLGPSRRDLDRPTNGTNMRKIGRQRVPIPPPYLATATKTTLRVIQYVVAR